MAEQNSKNLLDNLSIVMRYVASGLVAVTVYCYLSNKPLNEGEIWMTLSIAGAIGLFIYCLHHAFIDKQLYSISICYYIRSHKMPQRLQEAAIEWDNRTRRNQPNDIDSAAIKFQLINQFYLRKCSENKRIRALHKEMALNLAVLNFLYGSLYSLFIIPIYFVIKNYIYNHKTFCQNDPRIFCVGALAIFTLISTFYFDYYTTKREMWVVEYFFQEQNSRTEQNVNVPSQPVGSDTTTLTTIQTPAQG